MGLRSCRPSLSSTSLSLRTGRFPWSLSFSSCSTLIRCSTFVVQVQQVRVLAARTQSSSHSYSPFLGPGRSHARCVQRQMPMVVVLMQFIDLGGRRCDAAATSSSCRPQQLEWRVVFLGPCTQVQGREPCPQGHGSHNLMQP